MQSLDHLTAVVTGASSGIGESIVLGLAEEAMKLRLVGRNRMALTTVAECARVKSPDVITYATDLGQDDQIEELKRDLMRDCQGVDVLIHNAAVVFLGPVETSPVDELDQQYRINVRAPYILTQALLPMLRARHGQIVFVNSSVGLSTRANIAQYAATKHALKAIADCLRAEVNADGMRVLSVYPGRTSTPGQEKIHAAEGKSYTPERLLQPADVARIIIDALKAEKTAEITDISIRPMQKS